MEQYIAPIDSSVDERLRLFRKLDEASLLETVRVPRMIGFRNAGNTCAMDSVLVALLAHFADFGTDHKHPVRRKIAQWIENVDQCESVCDLVPLFKSFPSEDNFHVLGQPKDAVEFLIYFLKIFSHYVTSTKVFKTINRGVVTFASIDRNSSPVQYVPANVLVCSECVSVQDFIVNRNAVDGAGKITTEEIVQGDLVVFAFGRKMPDGTIVKTRVLPTESLTTPNGDRFFLGSIVVCENSHYVAYIRGRMTWYLYDDFLPSTREVGPFSEMAKWSPSPTIHGVLYFYFPDYSSVEEHLLSMWKSPTRLDVGVFEDAVTDKLITLHSYFDTVTVSSTLPVLKKLEKVGGELTLYVCDAPNFSHK